MTEHLGGSERELVLPPNSHAFILNNQKGEVEVFVGPYKANLDAKTDQPVIFDYNQKQFVHVNHLNKAINTNITAPEGWYLALKNPEKDNKHPIIGGQSGKIDLLIGKKINIKGPSSFALFPGQMCKVIKGHHLRSNQYLIVRIYDKTEAIAAGVIHDLPASQMIIDTSKTDDDKGGTAGTDTTLDSAKKKDESVAPATPASREVEVGQLMIIKGTEKSFYMPPTGVEVVLVKEKEGLQEYNNQGNKVNRKTRYVQDAVTLERLEYCVLLDEDGKKEYRMGPDVVFPKPTQEFIEKNGSRKFKAMSLNDISGIYIMVTNKYEEGGTSHKPGDELFITGKDTRIYYPREEHAIVKYDENEIHFATAIPLGEGRYVMDRAKGEIATEKGPKMLLPDPRTHVLIRRILTRTQCERWFPGNIEAIQYNRELEASNKESSDSGEIGYVSDANFRSNRRKRSMSFDEDDMLGMDQSRGVEMFAASASKGFTGDSIQKKQTYTKPRTVTIDTKFEGAVRINVYQGYAVAVESKSGEGRIVVGPKQFLLDYHENLVDVGLSQHTPKSKDHLYFTPYLRVLNNKVSDRVDAETRDHVEVEITLSYIIDFTGSKEGWFDVENYVLFATERLGSMVRNMVKQYGIEDFYTNGIVLIRDLILGKSEVMIAKEEIAEKIAIAKEIAIAAVSKDSEQEVEDWTEPEEVDFSKLSGDRPGRPFKENGMKVSDVEIQVISVGDDAIADLLTNAQTAVVEQTLELEGQKRTAEFVESQQSLQRRSNKAVHLTTVEKLENDKGASTEQLALNLQVAKEVSDVTKQNLTEQEAQEKIKDAIATVKRAVKKADDDQKFKTDTDQATLESTRIEACTKAFTEKFTAITPDLIAAMQANGDKQLALGMAQHLGPKAILGGNNLAEVMNSILKGTVLDGLDLTKKIEGIVDKELNARDEEY